MNRATVYRIGEIWDWDAGVMRDTTGVVAGFVVLRSEPAPSTSWLDSLKAVLANRTTYRQDDMLCIAIPEHVVRLYGSEDSVTVIFSSGCARVDVRSRGFSMGGWATASEGVLFELMNSALPSDHPEEMKPPALVLSAPHNYRRRDCACETREWREMREQEFAYHDQLPTPVSTPAPKLPSDLPVPTVRRVVLHVLVDREGRACRVKAIAGLDPFAVLAVDTVRGWRWKPANTKGKPECAWIHVPIGF